MPGTSFDQVASIYDATRGGERRGQGFADALVDRIVGPSVAELGIGTGVIAQGLQRRGLDVIGFDLSDAMMRPAIGRLGECMAIADVDVLPLADDSLDTAYFAWVLQLVEDPLATLAEAARVVRPGGQVIAILSNADYDPSDEIAPIVNRLASLRADRLEREQIVLASVSGLSLTEQTWTPWDDYEALISVEADNIENRIYSSLFDVDDATWKAVVVPVIEQLRALPEPDRPRRRRNRHPLIVWTVTPGV